MEGEKLNVRFFVTVTSISFEQPNNSFALQQEHGAPGLFPLLQENWRKKDRDLKYYSKSVSSNLMSS